MRALQSNFPGVERMAKPLNLRYVVFLACTGALGGLLFGFDIAIITGAGPFLARRFALSDIGLGWAFSSLLFGCVIGSIVAGRMADRFGRKRLLMWVAALFSITSVATAVAPSFGAFIAARLLGGVAVGAVSLLSPMYISEVSPPSIRGRMGTFYQLSIIIGILVSYGINYMLRDAGPENWRWMFATGIIPSATFFVLIVFAPETPRFLVRVGKTREALAMIERIENRQAAEMEVAAIELSLRESRSFWKRITRPGISRPLLVSACLAILIQISGINTIIDYAPAIFLSSGWKIDGALFSTLFVGVTEFVSTLVAFWVIDRFGRKPLYIWGSLGMAASLGGLLVAALLGAFHGALVLTLVLAYLAFFSACVGPVFWTLLPEIFPNDVRAQAMIVPVLLQWVANAIVVLYFPYAFDQVGKAATLGFFALMCLVQAGFTWRFIPETKNKALEEIEKYWLKAGQNLEASQLPQSTCD